MAAEPIAIKFYNLAGLNAGLVTAALAEARFVLAKAHAEARWIHRDASAPSESGDRASSGPRVFPMGLLNHDPRGGENRHALGFAMLGAARANSTVAFYSRIVNLVELNPAAASVQKVLANVIVHEIVHLLTRGSRHTHGIMSMSWTAKGLRAMAQRRLAFSTGEGEELALAIAWRR